MTKVSHLIKRQRPKASFMAILALMFVLTVPAHAQNGVSAVAPGTVLPAGTIAVVENVNNDEGSIDIFGGAISVDFEVGQWYDGRVQHNAWTGYPTATRAQDEARGLANSRMSIFPGYTIMVNGQIIAHDPNMDIEVHAASLTSGQWVTLASYHDDDVEVHAAQAAEGISLQQGQTVGPGVPAVWAELDINNRVVRIWYGRDHGNLTATIQPSYHVDVWAPFNSDQSMVSGACSTLAERSGQAANGTFGSQFSVLFQGRPYYGGPCPASAPPGGPPAVQPPTQYIGQPPVAPYVPPQTEAYTPPAVQPYQPAPQQQYVAPQPQPVAQAPTGGYASCSMGGVYPGTTLQAGTVAIIRIVHWDENRADVSVQQLQQDLLIGSAYDGNPVHESAAWCQPNGQRWAWIDRDSCGEAVEILRGGLGYPVSVTRNGSPLPQNDCPDP